MAPLPRLSARMAGLPAYPLAHIPGRKAALLAAGVDVIDLGAGDADLPPPPAAVHPPLGPAAAQRTSMTSPSISAPRGEASGCW